MKKESIRVILVLLGTMVGAGFASGQEMYLFFFSYGLKGLIGILISSSILGIVVNKTLKILEKNNSNNIQVNTYKDFLNMLIKTKDKKSNTIKTLINSLLNIFILTTFFIMVAGFGAYFEQQFGISSLIGSSILAILCAIIFMTSVKGVVKANEFIVPILIVLLIIIGILNFSEIDLLKINNYITEIKHSNFILSAVLYSSYNLIFLIPVLITLKKIVKNKSQIPIISIVTTGSIIILSIIVFFILFKVDVDIKKLEMPAVYVVSNMSNILKLFYGFIIMGSIFTTSISLGTSFLQNVAKSKKTYEYIAIGMCIISVLISKAGFSNLVNLLYPFFGYLGLLQVLRIVFI